jgi:hypothetical protein
MNVTTTAATEMEAESGIRAVGKALSWFTLHVIHCKAWKNIGGQTSDNSTSNNADPHTKEDCGRRKDPHAACFARETALGLRLIMIERQLARARWQIYKQQEMLREMQAIIQSNAASQLTNRDRINYIEKISKENSELRQALMQMRTLVSSTGKRPGVTSTTGGGVPQSARAHRQRSNMDLQSPCTRRALIL